MKELYKYILEVPLQVHNHGQASKNIYDSLVYSIRRSNHLVIYLNKTAPTNKNEYNFPRAMTTMVNIIIWKIAKKRHLLLHQWLQYDPNHQKFSKIVNNNKDLIKADGKVSRDTS
jgi:hypothetical protein